ncbi:MAG: cysteine hydrolase [Solirubrobacteraceae bacterium MAG38_C4-C5]|nr:cysteine hydrolase [Candidatus Siliceabacter maunaloa]
MIDPARTALLVIDAQVDFLAMVEDGSHYTCGAHEALAGVLRLVEAAQRAHAPIVLTQEVHRASGVDFGRELDGDESVHCLEGAPGTELVPALRGLAGVHMLRKRRYSAFFATDLGLLLGGLGVDTVVACGFLTDVCVHYTCADAHQHDLHVRVARDACAGSSAPASRAALAAVDYLQRGAVTTVDRLAEAYAVAAAA